MGKIIKLLILIGILYLTHIFWLPFVGTALLFPPEIQKADAIVVLRGDEFSRFQAAVALQKEGLAPRIITSVTQADINPYNLDHVVNGYEKLTKEDLVRRYFAFFNVSPQTVVLTGDEATSTYSEAVAARKVMEKNGWKSLILVTGPYHMRRSHFIFQTVFEGSGIKIYNATAKHPLFQPNRWWQKERDVRAVADEYAAFMANLIRYKLLKKTKPSSFDTV